MNNLSNSLMSIFQITLIILKAMNIITVYWWIVLLPTILPLATICLVGVLAVVFPYVLKRIFK